ncbi:MAG: Jag N-terminal domain-containing protein [Desulfovibrionaceae bacterium]|nr:Jag N-terminal domain-containing protein [Desulfovibrionaceae bacterium]
MNNGYKEFTGKNLDEAMAEACAFFGVERGKLEIEILSDAKSGIFGLVGAKKAVVRARRVHVEKLRSGAISKDDRPELSRPATRGTEKPKAAKTPAAPEKKAEPEPPALEKKQPEEAPKDVPAVKNQVRLDLKDFPGQEDGFDPEQETEAGESGKIPMADLDQGLLCETVLEAVRKLTFPIVGDCDASLEISGGKARVRLEGMENCGLLIGREGQTLAALRYLVGSIASRRLNAQVRVQIDAGDYQERQEEKLQALALALAEKVKKTKVPRSTKPLGAYQRRIVHLALQADPEVKTYSKSEGRLKRVVIALEKSKPDREDSQPEG